ncbi:MAG: hypothetical protein ACOYL3_28970 [Desulfuromonadaceae bacterium]
MFDYIGDSNCFQSVVSSQKECHALLVALYNRRMPFGRENLHLTVENYARAISEGGNVKVELEKLHFYAVEFNTARGAVCLSILERMDKTDTRKFCRKGLRAWKAGLSAEEAYTRLCSETLESRKPKTSR